MRVSAFDLAFLFCSKYAPTDVELTPEYKSNILKQVYTRLTEGWLAEDLIAAFERREGYRPKGGNLLTPGEMYYHNQLRLYPGPPKTRVDYNTGEIVRVSEPYFLEMKASYTVDDAIAYYKAQFNLNDVNERMYLGTFRHLLKTHDIDTYLFMIDCCVNHRKSDDLGAPTDPICLSDYALDAKHIRNAKITEERLAGVESVVPRRRVLVDRGGSGGPQLAAGVPA